MAAKAAKLRDGTEEKNKLLTESKRLKSLDGKIPAAQEATEPSP